MTKIANRKAYYQFTIVEEFNAGILLVGMEVKSIRMGEAVISNDSFIYLKNGEIWLKNFRVAKYKQSHIAEKHDENREKKLLLNKKEILRIERLIQTTGSTIIPLEVYSYKNLIKVKIGVAVGKKLHDKRASIRSREADREMRQF